MTKENKNIVSSALIGIGVVLISIIIGLEAGIGVLAYLIILDKRRTD